MQLVYKIIQSSNCIIWKFICDGCKAQAELMIPFDSTKIRPTGWGGDTSFTAKDFCPKCLEKIEIREVFK